MVTISVGQDFDDAQEFSVPQMYLPSVSQYFKNAFKGSFRKVAEKKLSLGDVQPLSFGIFVEKLHSHKLVDANGETYNGKKDRERKVPRLRSCSSCTYSPMSTTFRSSEEMFWRASSNTKRIMRRCVGPESSPRLTTNFPPSSLMLHFLVDSHVYSWSPKGSCEKVFEVLPKRFMYAMTKRFIDLKQDGKLPSNRSPYKHLYDYHEHDSEIETET
jgi:hypothetical protein